MTFGKCVWDGCTRHAEKESTGACRAHHPVIRDSRCQQCASRLTTRSEVESRRCRRCYAGRAA
jgi:hypothetical protein